MITAKGTWFVAPFAVTVVLDLLTKNAVEGMTPVSLAPFAALSLQYNTGISFGMLQATSPLQAWAIIAMTSLLLCGIVWLGLREKNAASGFAFGLIGGGAAGNIIDRLRDGRVTDFLDLHLGDWHWFAFNVADLAITLGLVVLLTSWRKENA